MLTLSVLVLNLASRTKWCSIVAPLIYTIPWLKCLMVFVEFEANETRKLRWHEKSSRESLTHVSVRSDAPWLLAPDCWPVVRALVSVEKGLLHFKGLEFFHIVQHTSLLFFLFLIPSIRVPPSLATLISGTLKQWSYILLYFLFWVIPWRLNFMCGRFGKLFHLHRSLK